MTIQGSRRATALVVAVLALGALAGCGSTTSTAAPKSTMDGNLIGDSSQADLAAATDPNTDGTDPDSDPDADSATDETNVEPAGGTKPEPPVPAPQPEPEPVPEAPVPPVDPGPVAPVAPPGTPDVATTDGFSGTYPLLSGGSLLMSSRKGTPMVIYVWAPNCTVCGTRVDSLRTFKQQNSKVRVMTMASADKPLSALNGFVTDHKISGWDNIDDRSGEAAAAYGVKRANTWILIQADGKYTTREGGKISDIEAWAKTQ